MEMNPAEIEKHLRKNGPVTLDLWEINNKILTKFNKDVFQDCMKTFIAEDTFLQYFSYGPPSGNSVYLDALSKFLSAIYDDDVKSTNLISTYGATFGFMLIMTHFLEKSDFLFTEQITFPPIVKAGKEYGLQPESVRSDNEGIDVVQLEHKIVECKEKNTHCFTDRKPFWGIIFLMTVCHNPTNIIYSENRCKALVHLAKKYNLLLLTDDVYHCFQYENVQKRLLAYDDRSAHDHGTGHVVSNGSVSKIMYPGMRLGWLESSEWIVQEISNRSDAISGGGFNHFNQGLAAKILNTSSFLTYLTDIKTLYENQLNITCDYLDKHLLKEVKFKRPTGSFFVWLELPTKYNAKDLNLALSKYGVVIWSGENFNVNFKHCFRICVSNMEKDEDLLLCLEILCKEVKNLLK